jgi:hypothetical protein
MGGSPERIAEQGIATVGDSGEYGAFFIFFQEKGDKNFERMGLKLFCMLGRTDENLPVSKNR